MKITFKNLTLAVVIGLFAMTACNSGSEAYKEADKAYDQVIKSIKNAKTCDDLDDAYDAFSEIDPAKFSEKAQELTPEEVQKLFKKMDKIKDLYNEREKKLCDD